MDKTNAISLTIICVLKVDKILLKREKAPFPLICYFIPISLEELSTYFVIYVGKIVIWVV
jgi:hypothetical protein